MGVVRYEVHDRELDQLLNGDSGPMARELNRRAVIIVIEAKRLLSTKGTGRTYVRRGRRHVASAPGQPPSVDTGRLRSSVHYQLLRTGSGLIARIGTNDDKARFLELGTAHIAPRPFLRPALVEGMKRG